MQNYKALNVWQKSHLFTLEIYKITSLYDEYDFLKNIKNLASGRTLIKTGGSIPEAELN